MLQWRRPRTAAPAAPASPPPEPDPEPPLPPRPPSAWEWMRQLRTWREEPAPLPPSVDALQARDRADYEARNAIGVEHITRVIARRGVWFPGDD